MAVAFVLARISKLRAEYRNLNIFYHNSPLRSRRNAVTPAPYVSRFVVRKSLTCSAGAPAADAAETRAKQKSLAVPVGQRGLIGDVNERVPGITFAVLFLGGEILDRESMRPKWFNR